MIRYAVVAQRQQQQQAQPQETEQQLNDNFQIRTATTPGDSTGHARQHTMSCLAVETKSSSVRTPDSTGSAIGSAAMHGNLKNSNMIIWCILHCILQPSLVGMLCELLPKTYQTYFGCPIRVSVL